MLKVLNGSITNEKENFLIDNLAMIVDLDSGAVLKYGDKEMDHMEELYEKKQKQNMSFGPDNALFPGLSLITFDQYDGKLSIEEICTFANVGIYGNPKTFLELLKIKEDKIHKRLQELKKRGY